MNEEKEIFKSGKNTFVFKHYEDTKENRILYGDLSYLTGVVYSNIKVIKYLMEVHNTIDPTILSSISHTWKYVLFYGPISWLSK